MIWNLFLFSSSFLSSFRDDSHGTSVVHLFESNLSLPLFSSVSLPRSSVTLAFSLLLLFCLSFYFSLSLPLSFLISPFFSRLWFHVCLSLMCVCGLKRPQALLIHETWTRILLSPLLLLRTLFSPSPFFRLTSWPLFCNETNMGWKNQREREKE